MTLLAANNTLGDIQPVEKLSYSYAPVSGVTINAHLTGSLAKSDNNVNYTVTANQADKLTFGSIPWKDEGALITRPANITFAGAAVDTTHIYFNNVQSLNANQQMTLVSDFGDSVGTITGTEYTVGTTLKGKGKASLTSDGNLIYTVDTSSTSGSNSGGGNSGGGNSGGGNSGGGNHGGGNHGVSGAWRSTVVSAAYAQIGGTYVWAACNPGARQFDCSGLTMYCYSCAGISISHSSGSQSSFCSKPISQAVAGDVVWRPGHVGIYVGGGNTIEALSPGQGIQFVSGGLYSFSRCGSPV